MSKYFLPLFTWLIGNNVIYGIYYYIELNQRLTTSLTQGNLAEITFLQPNPLFRLYLFSNLVIFIVGLIDIRQQIKKDQAEYSRKKDQQRRYYKAR